MGDQNPGEVLDCLISHHVLRRPDDGIGYAFSHQVYQEFYAAEKLRRQIELAFKPDAVDQAEFPKASGRQWLAAIIPIVAVGAFVFLLMKLV